MSGSEISVVENGRADEHSHQARDCLRGDVVRYADWMRRDVERWCPYFERL